MSKETYRDIAAVRYAEKKLWTPELSIDMLGRDWAQLDGPFGFHFTSDSINASTSPTVTDYTENISIEFPSDWDLDATFDDLEVAVRLRMTCVLDVAGSNFSVTLADTSDTYVSAGQTVNSTTPSIKTFTVAWPQTAVPTGRTEMKFRAQALTSDTNNCTISRTNDTPDCHIFVRYV